MANGQQIGDDNAKAFKKWRDAMNLTPELYKEFKRGKNLNKVKMADVCGFHDRGVFYDNSTVEEMLLELEAELRIKGILPKLSDKPNKDSKDSKAEEPGGGDKESKLEQESNHARRLEHDVVELKAERDDLRKEKKDLEQQVTSLEKKVASLESQLRRLEPLKSALADVGRLPR